MNGSSVREDDILPYELVRIPSLSVDGASVRMVYSAREDDILPYELVRIPSLSIDGEMCLKSSTKNRRYKF